MSASNRAAALEAKHSTRPPIDESARWITPCLRHQRGVFSAADELVDDGSASCVGLSPQAMREFWPDFRDFYEIPRFSTDLPLTLFLEGSGKYRNVAERQIARVVRSFAKVIRVTRSCNPANWKSPSCKV
jgi:hypothetical protein